MIALLRVSLLVKLDPGVVQMIRVFPTFVRYFNYILHHGRGNFKLEMGFAKFSLKIKPVCRVSVFFKTSYVSLVVHGKMLTFWEVSKCQHTSFPAIHS